MAFLSGEVRGASYDFHLSILPHPYEIELHRANPLFLVALSEDFSGEAIMAMRAPRHSEAVVALVPYSATVAQHVRVTWNRGMNAARHAKLQEARRIVGEVQELAGAEGHVTA
jgi:hypothetical protein